MKRIVILIIASIMLVSCVKHDEIEFAGYVVGVSTCAGYSAGYLVELSYPTDVGGTIVLGDETIQNVMILYEPAEHILVHEHISGTFYYDDNYAKANCNYQKKYDVPEGVFWKIQVVD